MHPSIHSRYIVLNNGVMAGIMQITARMGNIKTLFLLGERGLLTRAEWRSLLLSVLLIL
jgi:hypothetical protein